MEALDNSLETLYLVSVLGSTKLGQVNLILVRHTEAGPLMKNLEPSVIIFNQTQESSKLLSCLFGFCLFVCLYEEKIEFF